MDEFISAPEQTFVERVSKERASVEIIRSSGGQEAFHGATVQWQQVTLNRL
jgi:hypothetical protein